MARSNVRRLTALSVSALCLAASAPAVSSTVADRQTLMSTAANAFHDPQSPDVYRALSGMGDPEIGSGSATFDDDFWSTTDPTEIALLRRLLPSNESAADGSYWFNNGNCRVKQPLETLRQRIEMLGAKSAYIDQWIAVQRAAFSACSDRQDSTHTSKVPALPAAMPTHDKRIARLQLADRPYQQATALFYASRMAAAARAFNRIARSSSPHRYYARYMAIAIEAGTQVDRYEYKPLVAVSHSIADARRLLADQSAPAAVRQYAYELIGWIGANNQGLEARRAQVRQALDALELPLIKLTSDTQAQGHYADARDTRKFLFSPLDDAAGIWNGDIPSELTGTRAMAEAARTDPLAEWMIFPRSPFSPPTDAWDSGNSWALATVPKGAARVRAELMRLAPDPANAANPWAHETLMWSNSYNPSLWVMVDRERARAMTTSDQGVLDASDLDFYHQARTAVMYGGRLGLDAAVARLSASADRDGLIWAGAVSESLRYLMSTSRIADAREMRDRLGLNAMAQAEDKTVDTDGVIRSSGILDLLLLLAEDEDHLVPLLSNRSYDQAPLLNRLSINELRHLAERSGVPMEDRAAFARTAWTRTYALGRTVDARLNRLMRTLNPEITGDWLSRPGEAIKPGNRDALQDVLKTPGLNLPIDTYGRHRAIPGSLAPGPGLQNIDHNKRDETNWWCPWRTQTNDDLLDDALAGTIADLEGDTPFDADDSPSLWDQHQEPFLRAIRASSFLLRSSDATEITALTKLRSAPEILTLRTIDWVEHPGLFGGRKGQADALAAAIVTTRWGCDWAGAHGVYSRAAFRLLHQRFPLSDAAKRTKYWFDCNGACDADADGEKKNPRDPGLPSAPSLPSVPKREKALVRVIWSVASTRLQ